MEFFYLLIKFRFSSCETTVDDPASDQPFKWKSYAAVYNGEIYNFLDLKKILKT